MTNQASNDEITPIDEEIFKISDTYDNPWKSLIQEFFEPFVLFFFPDLRRQIDWNREIVFLDQELQQIAPENETGSKRVDVLVRLYLVGAREASWLLFHCEVQSQMDLDFPLRMYTYHYKLWDRYQRMVISAAILGDRHPTWRPSEFKQSTVGTSLTFNFSIAKLLDFSDNEARLLTTDNPFGLAVYAHLQSLKTKGDADQRRKSKFLVIKTLLQKGEAPERIRALLRFIDWVLRLPPIQHQLLQEEVATLKETTMEYITSFTKYQLETNGEYWGEEFLKSEHTVEQRKRIGEMYRRKGIEEGKLRGIEEGKAKGIEEGKMVTALNLLKKGIPDATIKECTQLSDETLAKLKQQISV